MKWTLALFVTLMAASGGVIIQNARIQNATTLGLASSACGVTFCENFEGWTNWEHQYTSPYRTNANGWDFVYTTSAGPASSATNSPTTGLSLEGLNCLQMIDPGADFPTACSPVLTGQSECWLYVEIRFKTSTVSPNTAFRNVQFLDASSNVLAGFAITTDGNVVTLNGTQASSSSVGVVAVDTTYFYWFHYAAGSGANGVASVGFNSSASRPTSGNNFVSVSNGDSTANAARIRLSPGITAGGCYFDKIRVYSGATPPPDSPP